MAILRGIEDQLISDSRLRVGNISVVDAEGVMTDGSEEIEDYYAGIVAQSTSVDRSRSVARDAPASHPVNPSNPQELESDMCALASSRRRRMSSSQKEGDR